MVPSFERAGRPHTNLDPGFNPNSIGRISSGNDSEWFRKGLRIVQQGFRRILEGLQKRPEALQMGSEGFQTSCLRLDSIGKFGIP